MEEPSTKRKKKPAPGESEPTAPYPAEIPHIPPVASQRPKPAAPPAKPTATAKAVTPTPATPEQPHGHAPPAAHLPPMPAPPPPEPSKPEKREPHAPGPQPAERQPAPVEPVPPTPKPPVGPAQAPSLAAALHRERPTPPAASPTGVGGGEAGRAPTVPDAPTRQLLRGIQRQESMRLEREIQEAEEMERRARDARKRVKEQERLRDELARQTQQAQRVLLSMGLDPNRAITEIPPLAATHLEQIEFFTVQENRSYIRISFDKTTHRYLYEAIEPTLTQQEHEMLDFLRDTLVRTMDGRDATKSKDWEAFLLQNVEQAIVDHQIMVDEVSKQRLLYFITRDFLGYGPIDVLMRDPLIEDISCDGPNVPLYIFHRQYESIRSNLIFRDEFDLDSFVIRLAQRCGKHISIAEPLLDATLPDTSRLQASLSREVTTRGSSFTIRKFRADPLTPPDLVRIGTLNAQMAAFYWLAMQEGNSLILAGGTASGKTTTLNAMCQFIPPEKKIVSIEDTREINLPHENWIAGLTRSGFGGEIIAGKVAGTIDMYKLLEAALRQRPEYLVVGEVRGPEALTLFQAMATGHATYSTLHADSVQSAVYRLEKPPINVPRIMISTADAIAIQGQVRIKERLVRRMKEVVEIVGIDPEKGDLLTNTVFEWDNRDDTHRYTGKSQILEDIMEKNNLTSDQVQREWDNRTRVIQWMVRKGIRHITDVADVVSAYYRTPDALMARVTESERTAAPGEGTIPAA